MGGNFPSVPAPFKVGVFAGGARTMRQGLFVGLQSGLWREFPGIANGSTKDGVIRRAGWPRLFGASAVISGKKIYFWDESALIKSLAFTWSHSSFHSAFDVQFSIFLAEHPEMLLQMEKR